MIQSYVVKVASKQDAMLAYYAEALSDLLDKRNGGRGDLVSAHVLTGHFRRELTSDNSHNCTLSVYIATTVPSHAPVYIVSDTPQAVARACYATLLDHSTGQRAQTQLHLVSLQYFSVEQLRADRSTRSAKNPDYTCGKQTVDACNVRLVEMQCTFCMD